MAAILFATTSLIKVHAQTTDSYTDKRDGKTYKIVKIGSQVWMAENLAYKPRKGNCQAYNNDQANVEKYGYLYDWKTANKAIPKGWHLPTKEEFLILLSNYGGDRSKEAYKVLLQDGKSGFGVVFAGFSNVKGVFNNKGSGTGFWTVSRNDDDNVKAWSCYLSTNLKMVYMSRGSVIVGHSVRLLKD